MIDTSKLPDLRNWLLNGMYASPDHPSTFVVHRGPNHADLASFVSAPGNAVLSVQARHEGGENIQTKVQFLSADGLADYVQRHYHGFYLHGHNFADIPLNQYHIIQPPVDDYKVRVTVTEKHEHFVNTKADRKDKAIANALVLIEGQYDDLGPDDIEAEIVEFRAQPYPPPKDQGGEPWK